VHIGIIQAPIIARQVLPNDDFLRLVRYLQRRPQGSLSYDPMRGRYLLSSDPVLIAYHEEMTPYARSMFGSATLLPSYALFARYKGPHACLERHKDDNACTYTIDLCVHQQEPWPLFVDGIELVLLPNEAAVYYGNDQLHWREPMQNAANHVEMIFFHFVEPEHWFFTEGPQHIAKIRSVRA
jgi:hypothetical protein